MVALALLLLILGIANLARAGLAWHYATRLPELTMTVSWAYLMVAATFWGATLITCSVGLVQFRPWGRWMTLVSATAREAHAWIDHLLFDANDYARQLWPRDLALTVAFLVIVWGLLNWPGMRKAFR